MLYQRPDGPQCWVPYLLPWTTSHEPLMVMDLIMSWGRILHQQLQHSRLMTPNLCSWLYSLIHQITDIHSILPACLIHQCSFLHFLVVVVNIFCCVKSCWRADLPDTGAEDNGANMNIKTLPRSALGSTVKCGLTDGKTVRASYKMSRPGEFTQRRWNKLNFHNWCW